MSALRGIGGYVKYYFLLISACLAVVLLALSACVTEHQGTSDSDPVHTLSNAAEAEYLASKGLFERPEMHQWTDIQAQLPSGYTQEDLRDFTRETFHVFREKYFADVPGVSPRQSYLDWLAGDRDDPSVTWVDKTSVTVSEAHGYGMLAIVLAADLDPEYAWQGQLDFDAFVRYKNAYPSPLDSRLMCWRQFGEGLNPDGSGTITRIINDPVGSNATDGDMDIAYALLLAHDLWGSDGGINYQREARKVIDGIRSVNIHRETGMLHLGDWAFMDTGDYHRTTRGSDFMLGHFRAFANADTRHADYWERSLNYKVAIIKQVIEDWSEGTGLLPDFMLRTEDGSYEPSDGRVLETEYDGDYNWNNCRVPWRFAADYLSYGDPVILDEIEMLNEWIKQAAGGDASRINAGYYIRGGEAGSPIEGRSTGQSDFAAPFMLSAAVSDQHQDWLDSSYTHNIDNLSRYYGDSIRLHSLFVLSGVWRLPNP
ncbi:hypothetical protein JCM12856_03080 [Spirochaeta dissipatitropha]